MIVWVVVVVEVDELDGCRFALVAVVLEDVLDQLCREGRIFLLCLQLRHTLEDIFELLHGKELVRDITLTLPVRVVFHRFEAER